MYKEKEKKGHFLKIINYFTLKYLLVKIL